MKRSPLKRGGPLKRRTPLRSRPEPSHLRRSAIRRLAPGEPIPEGDARRYRTKSGYMVLRWKVGKSRYVEVLEHRAVMGNPEGMHVHHINGIRDDNRPENLEVVDPVTHLSERHGATWADEAVDLYNAGYTTIDISKMLGVASSGVYRQLARRGVTFRSKMEYERAGIDVSEVVRQRTDEGLPPGEIAALMSVGEQQVRAILRERNVPSFRAGRPKAEDLELRKARMAVYERSGGDCEAQTVDCTGRGQHVHHMKGRSTHDPALLLHVCLMCHNRIHAHPAESYEQGWMVRRVS